MRHPEFAGCWTKIDRAHEHRTQLQEAAKAWLDAKPYKLRTDFYSETKERIVRLERAPEVPLRLLAIIGDVVHNLRSALDHFIYRVAVLESGQDPPPKADRLAFPFCITEEDFDTRGDKSLGKISEPVRASIKRLQPFATHPANPSQSALWVLHRLDIIDKHREFPLALAVVTVIPISASGPISVHAGPDPGPLEDNAQILAYRSVDPKVNVNLDLAFEIAFGKSDILPEGHSASDALLTLAENVETVVGSVEPAT